VYCHLWPLGMSMSTGQSPQWAVVPIEGRRYEHVAKLLSWSHRRCDAIKL